MVSPNSKVLRYLATQVKIQGRQIVYNIAVAERTEFALVEILVFIIANFILIWLFPISANSRRFANYFQNKYKLWTSRMV